MGRAWLRHVVVLATSLLALPSGAAESVEGTLSTRGTLDAPDETRATGSALVALAQGQLADALVWGAVLRVAIYERQSIAGFSPLAESRSFTISDATIGQVGASDERAYASARSARATATISAEGSASFTPADFSVISSHGESTPDAPDQFWFHEQTTGDHVLAKHTGRVTFCGPISTKLFGMVLYYQGAENTTAQRVRTGHAQDDPVRGRDVWVLVESDDACLSVNDATQTRTIFQEVAIQWEGELFLGAQGGKLETPSATYSARGERTYIDGKLTATLTPAGGERGTVRLQGELARTSLLAMPIPRAPSAFGDELATPIFLIVGIVTAAAVGALGYKQGRLHLKERAQLAQESGDHAQAARLLKLIPKPARDADDATDLAFALATLGRIADADAALREAMDKGAKPEAALGFALALLHNRAPPTQILYWINRAIVADPKLIRTVEGPDFATLQDHPLLREIMRRARDALDDENP